MQSRTGRFLTSVSSSQTSEIDLVVSQHFWKLIVSQFLALVFAASAGAADSLEDRIDQVVPVGFSGQIAIGSSDSVMYSKSFGLADREEGIAVTNETYFDVGSITKTFTATAILMLVEKRSVSLDQTLGDYFAEQTQQTSTITIHQLLTHTSGLPLYSGEDDEACDTACFDDWLAEIEPEFSPGTKYQYSNPGYSALARIIEIVSGEPYESFLREKLVRKLRLGTVGYLQLPESADYAVGYYEGQRMGRPPELGWMPDGPPWHLRGNGGLLTNAEGLLRWLQATATGRTLTAELQRQQIEQHARRGENAWYGYGWTIFEQPWGTVIDHTGGNGFFFADARWVKDRNLLIAITNNAFDRESTRALLNGIRAALNLTADE